MSKAEIDEYVATVKAGVDFVSKAREARSKPLTEQQIAAYGDYPPYADRSFGISKEEVDAYIANVKAEVDAIAAARSTPVVEEVMAEEAVVTTTAVTDASPKEMPKMKETKETDGTDWGVIGGTIDKAALRKTLLSLKYAPTR
eukprot:CAMPEP_0205910750 /NCGR_PEP_ID=MMETSP1325-20131115/4668_1 /ASSEMBLY_ACC=CAM_ASM_000708 /TAXON_ID=236786 /ORGANISM="Florenciella sp., Strain RCC1007" /LENGTH=142 /DNA_ID=CAMNT_0053277157 /DNA_START=54 /DNA_END=482 /DNA_ORIENTATION=+